jgi:methylenetetrahydrofolate reductase (NADPH)
MSQATMTATPPLAPPAQQTETARIADWVRRATFEATRPTDAELDNVRLPRGARVYLSAIPSRSLEEQIAAAIRLHARGFEPVPHVAARNFATAAELDRYLARLTEKAGVRSLLVIGGDREAPAGAFHHAIEVIESGLPQSRGIREIGIAGYPEGHPRAAQLGIERALTAKIDAARETGLAVHIVTQFAFSAEPILAWIRRMRDLGIDQPIRVGIAGPASLATHLRFAAICGVKASARALARNAGLAKHLFGTVAPDTIIRTLARDAEQFGEVSPHFFTFGGLAATARWSAAISAGRITPDRAGGFRVDPP